MLELYHSEPNTFYLKPLIALHEKHASFQSRWFDSDKLEQFALGFSGDVEAHLHLEREGPLLLHDGTLISSSFFMLEYIAEAGPGDFIYVPPFVPHQEINASDDEPLSCVLCRSGQEPVVVNLELANVESSPQQVEWVDDLHPGS